MHKKGEHGGKVTTKRLEITGNVEKYKGVRMFIFGTYWKMENDEKNNKTQTAKKHNCFSPRFTIYQV